MVILARCSWDSYTCLAALTELAGEGPQLGKLRTKFPCRSCPCCGWRGSERAQMRWGLPIQLRSSTGDDHGHPTPRREPANRQPVPSAQACSPFRLGVGASFTVKKTPWKGGRCLARDPPCSRRCSKRDSETASFGAESRATVIRRVTVSVRSTPEPSKPRRSQGNSDGSGDTSSVSYGAGGRATCLLNIRSHSSHTGSSFPLDR